MDETAHYIPTLSLVAALIRDFTPRWNSSKLHGQEDHCVYRWENHERLIVARFPFRKHAQAYVKQLNAEELLTMTLIALYNATGSSSLEERTFRIRLTALHMELPTCPDPDMFKTQLYPFPRGE
jgi:hypothetical protein